MSELHVIRVQVNANSEDEALVRVRRLLDPDEFVVGVWGSSSVTAAVSEDSPRAARSNRVEALRFAVDSAMPGSTPTQILRAAAGMHAYVIDGTVPDNGDQS